MNRDIPALPPGFVMEPPQSAADSMPALPPGFQLDAPQQAPSASPRGSSGANAAVLGALDGVTFGFADEIGSGLDWAADRITPGVRNRSYDEILAANRGDVKAAEEEHPYAYTGGQIAGGVGAGVASVAAAPGLGARALGVGAQSLGGRLTAAGTTGLVGGAVQGFGSGEGGLENRSWEALKGAGIGAGLGLGSVPLASAAGAGVNAVLDRFAASRGPVGRASQDLLGQTLENDGLTLEGAQQLGRELGPSAMLADMGPTLRLRAEQIAQHDNAGRPSVVNALRDRSATAGGRINSAYDASLGSNPNVQQTLSEMTRAAKTRADTLYGEARRQNAPVDVAPVLQSIDDQLLTPAERIAGQSGLPTDEVDDALAWVRSHLSDGNSQRTGIDRLDRLERRLRARTKAAFSGGKSDVGHALNEVGKVLRGQMKASSSVYAEARATFADDMAQQEAFDAGRKLFGSGTHPDFLAAEVAEMSQAERDALRIGVRAAVDQAMGQVRNGSLKGRQLLDADWNERKILTVLGEDDGRALINALQGEQAMAETANQVLGGPATARRLADNPFNVERTQQNKGVPGILRSAGNLDFGDAAARGVEYVQDALGRRSARTMAEELGPALTATGETRDELLDALLQVQARRGGVTSEADKRRAIAELLTRGGALGLAPSVHP